jgi:hypothetical protein
LIGDDRTADGGEDIASVSITVFVEAGHKS